MSIWSGHWAWCNALHCRVYLDDWPTGFNILVNNLSEQSLKGTTPPPNTEIKKNLGGRGRGQFWNKPWGIQEKFQSRWPNSGCYFNRKLFNSRSHAATHSVITSAWLILTGEAVLRIITQTCSFNLLTASHECYQKLAFGFSPKPVSIPFTHPFFCGATAHSGLGRLIVRVSMSHTIAHKQTNKQTR